MTKFIYHIKTWNRWRKRNLNSKWHKFLVLIGLVHSPTFEIEKLWNDNTIDYGNL